MQSCFILEKNETVKIMFQLTEWTFNYKVE